MSLKIFGALTLGAGVLTCLFVFFNWCLGISIAGSLSISSFLANFLVAIVVWLLIKNNRLSNWNLVLFVFAVYFLIGHFNILIEAYIFDVTNRHETILELWRGCLVVLVFSPIAYLLFNQEHSIEGVQLPNRSIINWMWRILLGNFLYLIFYASAGMILTLVYPTFLAFYEGKIPPLALILKTQLFLRGFVFVGVCMMINNWMNLRLWTCACLTGVTFAVLGGVAPLLSPNELMPSYVRYGHLLEVGISNFLYGILLTLLIGQRRIFIHSMVGLSKN